MNIKKDYFLVTLIGFLVGWLSLLPVQNLGLLRIGDAALSFTPKTIAALVIGFTLLAPILFYVLRFFSRFIPVFVQFGKFAAVGTLNTFLDIGILNLLMALTGIASGAWFSAFKAVSFIVSITNSYFWNKFWTFESKTAVRAGEYGLFLLVALGGVFINVSVATVLVNVFGAPEGFNPRVWANVGALIAVFAAMLWNFIMYRRVVFRR